MTPVPADICRNHYHTRTCKDATDLAEFPHDMVAVDTLGPGLDWIKTDECCKRCYASRPLPLQSGCREHPDRTPTLSFHNPTCNGCLKEVTHDGDSFTCETCKVYWSDNPSEDENGERWDDDEPAAYACAASIEPTEQETGR